MRHRRQRWWSVGLAARWQLLLVAAAIVFVGCSDDGDHGLDGHRDAALDALVGDGPSADRGGGGYRVAAVQYANGDYSAVVGCSNDTCALVKLVEQAAANGAEIVVTPEYALYQEYLEWAPAVGDTPATDATWEEGEFLKVFSKLADRLDTSVMINLQVQEGEEPDAKYYNALVVFDGAGEVIARHYKFELFGGEADGLDPGTSITTSLFDTPAGKAGLLICADAQCFVTGMATGPSCHQNAVDRIAEYGAAKPDVYFFSTAWTVGSSGGIWWSVAVQEKIATTHDVWVVTANTTGDGRGGGILQPDGEWQQLVESDRPSVVYGELPLK